jgi:hypothetical protein
MDIHIDLKDITDCADCPCFGGYDMEFDPPFFGNGCKLLVKEIDYNGRTYKFPRPSECREKHGE